MCAKYFAKDPVLMRIQCFCWQTDQLPYILVWVHQCVLRVFKLTIQIVNPLCIELIWGKYVNVFASYTIFNHHGFWWPGDTRNHGISNHGIDLPSNLYYKSHQIPKFKWFSSRLAVALAPSIEARRYVKNGDVVGAAPTGGAPTTSEWSTILLAKVPLISEVLQ